MPSTSKTPTAPKSVDQRNSVEIIDLTMSSSPAPEKDSMDVEDELLCVSSNAFSGRSSPVEYGSGDEEEVGCCKVELNLHLPTIFPQLA